MKRPLKKYDPDNLIYHGNISDKIKQLEKDIKALKKLKKKKSHKSS